MVSKTERTSLYEPNWVIWTLTPTCELNDETQDGQVTCIRPYSDKVMGASLWPSLSRSSLHPTSLPHPLSPPPSPSPFPPYRTPLPISLHTYIEGVTGVSSWNYTPPFLSLEPRASPRTHVPETANSGSNTSHGRQTAGGPGRLERQLGFPWELVRKVVPWSHPRLSGSELHVHSPPSSPPYN